MKHFLKTKAAFLADLVFVKRCPCCGKAISLDTDVCGECFSGLLVPKNICKVCGEPEKSCACSKRRFLYEGFTAPFYNTAAAKQGVYRYKFGNQRNIARFFGKQMAERLEKVFPDILFDMVVSVPPNRKTLKSGGFDHSKILAKSVAEYIGVRYKGRVLKKCADNLAQHTLNYEERVKNVERAYKVTPNLRAKRILLIDDIKTTGATLNECSKQLSLAGARYVYCLTAVMSPKEDMANSDTNLKNGDTNLKKRTCKKAESIL